MWSLTDYRGGKPLARFYWNITDDEWERNNPFTPLNPNPMQDDEPALTT